MQDILASLEDKYQIPRGLLNAVMTTESNGDGSAVSQKGARGYFQFMPATAKAYGVNPHDFNSSADGAARMYSDLLKMSGGDLDKALAYYNYGSGNVNKYGMEKLPKETSDYITKVKARMPTAQIKLDPESNPFDKFDIAPAPQAAVAEEPNPFDRFDKTQAAPKKRGIGTEVARQGVGLPMRDIIEGGSDVVGIFSDPIAGLSNRLFGTDFQSAHTQGKYLADKLGLPAPENERERIVNEGAKLGVGSAGFVKAGQAISKVGTGVAKKVGEALATRPDLQVASGAGAGSAGQWSKESGDEEGAQLGMAVAGGLAAPFAANKGTQIVESVKNLFTPKNLQAAEQAIQRAGIDLSQMAGDAANSLRADVVKALQSTKNLSVDGIRRLADYHTVGATPLRSNLTLNPIDITAEKNLAKIGANSKNPRLHDLAMNENKNNAQLIGQFDNLGATNDLQDVNRVASGRVVMDGLESANNRVKSLTDNLYGQARNTAGRSAELDPSHFTQRAGDLLKQDLAEGSLSPDVRAMLNNVATGKTPLTVDVAEQIKTVLARKQRLSADGNERHALGLVRQALEETPLLQGQQVGQQSIDAFNQARQVHAKWMKIVESTPALKAVRDGEAPDNFVQKYIISAKAEELKNLKSVVNASPEALAEMRAQLATHLKRAAIGNNPNEVGKFSPAGFNNALQSIGLEKLKLFFTPEEINMMRAMGRVASYERVQPIGAAVNNSNTASTVLGRGVDWLGGVARKIPGGGVLANEANELRGGWTASGKLDASKAIQLPKPQAQKQLPYAALFPLLTEQNTN